MKSLTGRLRPSGLEAAPGEALKRFSPGQGKDNAATKQINRRATCLPSINSNEISTVKCYGASTTGAQILQRD
jgi:hypothetical protein